MASTPAKRAHLAKELALPIVLGGGNTCAFPTSLALTVKGLQVLLATETLPKILFSCHNNACFLEHFCHNTVTRHQHI